MYNQLFQVFRTYYTRRDYWIFACLLLPIFITMIHSHDPADKFVSMIPLPYINIFIGIVVGMQIKLQFANPRARLLPGFSTAHLLTAASIISIALLIQVGIASPIYGVPYFALGAYALFWIALTAWNAYLMRGDFNILWMILMISSMLWPKNYVAPFFTSGIYVSLSVFCISLAALAALGIRLMMLTEEMPDYARVMPGSMWDFLSRSARRDQGRLEAQMIARSTIRAWLQDIMFRLVFREKNTVKPPGRLLLRQLAGGFSSVFIAVYLFAFMFAFLWFSHCLSWYREKAFNNIEPQIFMSAFMSIPLTFNIIVGFWLRRWPYLSRELLFPISRPDFARDLVHSRLIDMAGAAAGFFAGNIIGLALFYPQWFLSGSTLLYIAMTIAQFFLVGFVVLWVASFRSFIFYILGCAAMIMLSMVLIFTAVSANWMLSSISIVATAAGIAGSYRLALWRWCNVELD